MIFPDPEAKNVFCRHQLRINENSRIKPRPTGPFSPIRSQWCKRQVSTEQVYFTRGDRSMKIGISNQNYAWNPRSTANPAELVLKSS